MQKFLRTMMLIAALALPFASNAQVTADRTYLSQDFSVANPEGWTGGTSAYAPTFNATGNPSWMYTEYAMNGLAAGHYYYNMFAQDRYQWLVSPQMDLTESGQAQMRYDIVLTAFSGSAAPDSVDAGKKVMVLVRTRATANGSWSNWTALRTWVKEPAEGQLDLMSIAGDAYTADIIDFADYLGRYVQVAFYCENTTSRATSVNIHVDNVVVDGKIRVQAPTDVAVAEVGTTTATLTWADELNAVKYQYEVMAWKGTAVGDTVYALSNGTATTATVNGLQPASNYSFAVRTWSTSNTTDPISAWSGSVSAFTHYASPVVVDAENPYINNFEEGAEGWQFVNHTTTGNNPVTNGWYYATENVVVGHDTTWYVAYAMEEGDDTTTVPFTSAAAYEAEGLAFLALLDEPFYTANGMTVTDITESNHVLWVSNDGGATNAYTTSGQRRIFAYMPVQLEAGDYDFSYNWRSRGETGNYDYVRAMVVNENTTLSNDNDPSSIFQTANQYNQTSWQDYSTTFTIGSDGIYKLVLMWRNDNSGGSQPPASIDNIVLKKVVSFPVQNLAVVDSLTTANSLTIAWDDTINADATYRIVVKKGNDTLGIAENVEGNTFTVDTLTKSTAYSFTVYTEANGVESHPANPISGTTNPNVFAVTAVAATDVTRSGAVISWTDELNVQGTTYNVIVKQGNDTVADIENAESGLVVSGLESEVTYNCIVNAIYIDTAAANGSFTTLCPQVAVTPAHTYTVTVQGYGSYYTNYGTFYYSIDGEQTQIDWGSHTINVPEGADFSLLCNCYYYYMNSCSASVVDESGNELYDGSLPYQSYGGSTYYPTITFLTVNGVNCVDPEDMAVTVSDRTQNGATITWNNPLVEDATEYEVIVKSSADTIVSETVEGTTFEATGLTPSTNYTVQVNVVYSDGYVYSSDVVAFETMGPCNAPDDFAAVAGRTTIALSWTQADATVETYQLYCDTIEVNPDTLADEAFVTVEGNDGYTAVDLEADHTYYIHFRANCGDNKSAWRHATVHTLPFTECGDWAVNHSASSYNNAIPVNSYYKYGLTEMLVSAEELEGEKTLSSITYYVRNDASGYTRNIDIYMQPYDGSTLSSAVNLNSETAVQVFSGNVSFNAATTIEFTTPYEYNGEGGILVIVDDNTGSYNSNVNFVTGGNGMAYYKYSDGTNYDPTAATTYSMSSVTRPKMTFGYCVLAPACASTEPTVSDIDYNTATINWERPDCQLNGYLMVVSGNPDTIVLDDVNTHTLALGENADYTVSMAVLCGNGDTSAWNTVSFSTPAFCRVAANMAAEVNGKNSAVISWESTDTTQAANYDVLVLDSLWNLDSLDAYTGAMTAEGVDTTAYTATGLDYEKTYYAYVRNVCVLDGNEALAPWAGPATFTTLKQMPAVINLTAEGIRNTVVATWESDSANYADESQWRVAIAGHDSVPAEWVAVDTNAYTFAVDFDSVYDVYVVAINDTVHSDTVKAQNIHTGIAMPAPVALSASAYRDTVTFTWQRNEVQHAIETAWQVAIRHADDDSTALVWYDADTTMYVFEGVDFNTTHRVYVRAINGEDMSDSVFTNVSTSLQMPAVVNVRTTQLSHNYAQVEWNRGNQAIENEWAFGFKKSTDSVYAWTVINHMDTMIYGLDELTTYNVRIAALMDGMSSDSVNSSFNTTSKASALANCIALADGTNTNSYLPVYGNYNYSLSQSIYTAEELADAIGKPITKISYHVSNTGTRARTFRLYLQPTDKSSFSSTSDRDALRSDAVMVFEGTVQFTAGWQELVLSTPYVFDGNSNLLVIAEDITGGWNNYPTFYGENGLQNRSLYAYNDDNPYDPANPSFGYRSMFRPAVQFCYTGQYIQDLAVENVTETSAEASWMPGGHETEWQYVNATAEMTDAELDAAEKVTVSEQAASLIDLVAGTDYTFYVRAHEVLPYEVNTVYVFDSIYTWYDTTYSKENPLEQVVITHNDSVMKVLYDTTCVIANDTVAALPAGKVAIDTIMSVENPAEDSLYVYVDTTCTYAIHYDTTFNVDWYSDWCKVGFHTTDPTYNCDEPLMVRVAGATTNSALVLGVADAAAMNFRYAVAGSDEYITVAGIDSAIYDTTVNNYITVCFTYGEEGDDDYEYECQNMTPEEYAQSESMFETYEGLGYVIDTTVVNNTTIDTISFFYAYLEPLTPNTEYVVAGQSVCGEEDASAWSEEVTFTTEYECGQPNELPFTETFEATSVTAQCWSYAIADTITDVHAAVTNGRLYPAGNYADHSYIPTEGRYDRYFFSPELEDAEASLYWTSNLRINSYNESVEGWMGDSIAFGYSTTDNALESFTWTEMKTNNGGHEALWTNTEILPAGTKYVAYHVVCMKPDWTSIEEMTVKAADYYTVNVYNANAEMGTVTMVTDSTLPEAAEYHETLVEQSNINLIATADNGYRFTGWEAIDAQNHRVVVSNNGSINFNAADTVLIATFAVNSNTVRVAIADNIGTVTMEAAGSADTNNVVLEHGAEVTLTAVDTNTTDNKIFRGWSLSNNANIIVSYEPTYTFNVNAVTNGATQTYTAMFVQDSFNIKVNYDVAMGTVTNNNAVIDSNRNFARASAANNHLVATPNFGYEFVGWTNANGDSLTVNASFDTNNTDMANLEFNANFQTLPFYVQVASNDETRGTASVDTTGAQYLDTVNFTATEVDEHSHFIFWKDLVNGAVYTENPLAYVVTEDANLMAFFDIDSHYVKVVSDIDNYGYVTINGEQVDSVSFPYGTEGIEIEAMPNTGVAFVQWSDENTDNPRTFTLENDTTFTAEFDSIVYTIAVNVNAIEGTVYNEAEEAINEATGKYLDTLTFVAEANTGFKFSRWEDAEGNIYTENPVSYVVTAAEAQSLTAYFGETGKINVTLAANVAEGASIMSIQGQTTVAGIPGDTTYIYGDESHAYNRFDSAAVLTLHAEPAEHYHFLNWTLDGEFYSANTETTWETTWEYAGEDAIATADFIANFEIDTHMVKAIAENGTFTYNGVEADSVYVDYGTEMTVVAVPANHYHFLSWEDGRTATDTTFTVEADVELNATFELDTFAVTPAVNNELFGSVAIEGKVADTNGAYWYSYGDTAYITTVANTGYHFVNWSTGATTETGVVPVYGSNTITANFDTNVYTVTLVAENGTIEGATSVKHFTAPEYVAVADYGYHFAGWTGVESENDTAVLTPVSDITITATFEKNSYTVAAAANYDSLGTVGGDTTVLYLDTATLYATAIEGYHVENWSNGMTGDTIQVIADSTKTVTANFAINVYNVTATANIAERGTINGAHATEHGALDTLVAVPNYGYTFEGWNNGVQTDTLVLTVVRDTTVIASFGKAQFNVLAAVNDTAMGTATANNATALYFDSVEFTATANAHYRFVNWSNGDTAATTRIRIEGDTTLTANFEAIMWTVSVSSAVDSMGTVNPAGDSLVMEGSSFTATATANTGFHFVSWNTGATTESITVTVDSNIVLVATFAEDTTPEPVIPQYTVILTTAQGAMGSVSAGATVDSASTFTATATPNDGYHFVAWLKGIDTVSTDAVYTFVVTEDVTLVAHFASDQTPGVSYTVTAEVNDPAMGTVTGGGSYEEGAECVLVAHANEGYRFVKWMNGDQEVGPADTIFTFTVQANITITAVFEPVNGIEDVDMNNVTIYSTESKIVVRGAESQSIYVFDVNGRVVTSEVNAAETCEFRMATTGVYLVKVGNAPAKRVLVVR